MLLLLITDSCSPLQGTPGAPGSPGGTGPSGKQGELGPPVSLCVFTYRKSVREQSSCLF